MSAAKTLPIVIIGKLIALQQASSAGMAHPERLVRVVRSGRVVRPRQRPLHLLHAMNVSTDSNTISTIHLACGATLVAEHIPNVASAAMNWLLPLGSATDPADCNGHAALLAELIFRGAGGMTSREHSDALDRLGIQRSSDVATHHLHLRATMLAS